MLRNLEKLTRLVRELGVGEGHPAKTGLVREVTRKRGHADGY